MLTITDEWVKEGSQERELLESRPETAVLVPHLVNRHQTLLETQPAGEAELDRLSDQAADLDSRHDDLYRGIFDTLSGAATLSHDEDMSDRLINARDTLMPDGLSAVLFGYRDEAGATMVMESQLTSELRALLRTISFPGDLTLEDAVVELIRVGRQLGQIEDRRAELENHSEEISAGDVLVARNDWIRLIRAVVSALELSQVDPRKTDVLLAPLNEAVKVAERRAQRRSSDDETPTTDEDESVEPPTDTPTA
jgi:hypothetical protein